MNTKPKVIVIVGPTAVGKTRLSLTLAKLFDTEIISADSMQIFHYMNIGTAKIKPEEMGSIVHHLLDIRLPGEPYSVEEYRADCLEIINRLHRENKIPIVVGGTGLYVHALTYNLDFSETEGNEQIRQDLWALHSKYGSQYLHDLLFAIDPQSAEKISPNNTKRVIRALEVYEMTGKPFSSFHSGFRRENQSFDFIMFGLTDDRENLYRNINVRIDQMLADGLVEEVKSLQKFRNSPSNQAFQAIGYKEVFDYLDGLDSFETMVQKLKQNSRKLAKRQLTWFRRDPRIHWKHLQQFSCYQDLVNSCLADIQIALKKE